MRRTTTALFAVVLLAALTMPMVHAARVDQNTATLLGLRPMQTSEFKPDLQPTRAPDLQNRQGVMAEKIGLQPHAVVTSNNVIYSPLDLINVQQIETAWAADGKTFACYSSVSFSGTYSLSCDGVDKPLVIDGQLTGGLKLTTNGFIRFGAYRDASNVTVVFFLAVDPNHTVGSSPALILWYADSNGKISPVVPGIFSFTAPDPRNAGANATFTVSTLSGLEVRNGKAITLAVATPTTLPGESAPAPEGFFIQVGLDKQVKVLFNNTLTLKTFFFDSVAGFAATNNALYLFGQLAPADPVTSATAVAVVRVQNNQTSLVKGYFEPAGVLANSWLDGIQIYGLDSTKTGLVYSFIPDNSLPVGSSFKTGEIQLFAGTTIEGIALNSRDTQIITGNRSLYVVTSGRSLLEIDGVDQTRLVHSPSMIPQGSAISIAVVSGQKLYVQNEGSVNRTYILYQPALSQAVYFGLPGDIVPINGDSLVVDGKLPSVTLAIGGRNVSYGADSNGKITVNIPLGVLPGVYNGTVNVQGVVLPLVVQVQNPGQPTAVITSVQNGANFQASTLVPEELITIFLAKPVGSQANAQTYPTYELGGVSAQLDGIPMPLNFSGQGQVNALLPKAAQGKTRGIVTVGVRYGTTVITSVPFSVNIGISDDSFFQWYDPTDGQRLAIITDSSGSLIQQSNLASPGQILIGYGTGCAPTTLPDDDKLVPTSLPSAVFPTIFVGGKGAKIGFAGLAQGFAGLCQYNFEVPAGLAGDVAIQFAGNQYGYLLRLKK